MQWPGVSIHSLCRCPPGHLCTAYPVRKFTDSETGESIDLTAKEYRIVAELVGEPVTNANRDAQALALMPYWQAKSVPMSSRSRSTTAV
ncbi:MAG: hypothetical protein U0892_08110 [Pirellulales bacterium]